MAKLHLAVKNEYFLAMKSGEKLEEYRQVTDYWLKRLYQADGSPQDFESVIITDGYPKSGDPERTLDFPWRGFERRTITHPHFGPDPVEVFAIAVQPNIDITAVGTREVRLHVPHHSLMNFTRDGKVGNFDIVDGKFDYRGELPVTDAARSLFDHLLALMGDELLSRASQVPAPLLRVRHRTRGSDYEVIGVGRIQSEMWEERGEGTIDRPAPLNSVDMREVTIYRSVDDGSLWVRPREEFEDGRFLALATAESQP